MSEAVTSASYSFYLITYDKPKRGGEAAQYKYTTFMNKHDLLLLKYALWPEFARLLRCFRYISEQTSSSSQVVIIVTNVIELINQTLLL